MRANEARVRRDARLAARHPDRRRRARASGYFWAIELVRDRATKETFSEDECEWLLRGFLSGEIFKNGLICRADDRGDPVIQLAPPLIAGPEQFEEIRAVLRPALEEASRRLDLA